MPVTSHLIVQILASELGAMRELRGLLKEEQAHLIAADIDALSKLTDMKAAVVSRSSEFSAQRDSVLAALDLDVNADSIRSGLAAHAPQARVLWDELMTVGAEAKEMNRTNGLLVNRQMVHNQNALQILQGSAPPSHFYGPNGQSSVGKSGRSFVAV